MRKIAVIAVLAVVIGAGVLLSQAPGPRSYPAQYAAGEEAGDGLASPVKETGDASPAYEQKIIMSAIMTLEVKDFEKAYEDATAIAAGFGGFIADSYSFTTDTGRKKGRIAVRLPQDEFIPAVSELEKVGLVKSKRVSGNDVTEEYIDLEAGLRNLERQENRLLEILDKAGTVEEILKVEKELARVRGEIERTTGRLRYLDNKVELAAITLELYEPGPVAPPATAWGVKDALRKSLSAFIGTSNTIIVALGTAMPFVLLAAMGYLAYMLKSRRNAAAASGK